MRLRNNRNQAAAWSITTIQPLVKSTNDYCSDDEGDGLRATFARFPGLDRTDGEIRRLGSIQSQLSTRALNYAMALSTFIELLLIS